MKRVIVCYKWVRDAADIRIDPSTRKVNLESAAWMLNDFDRNAIELGVQVKATTGCELIGITAGVDTESSAKDVLSRGLDSLVYLNDPVMARADSRTTSKLLAAMIRNLGGADLVICSEASDDEYAQQNSARIAALLNYSSVTYVQSLAVAGDLVKVSRKLEDGVEDVEVSGPLVVSVVPDVNDPPMPSVRQILGAKKKPLSATDLASLGVTSSEAEPQMKTESLYSPEVTRKKIHVNAGGLSHAEAAQKLFQLLVSDGVL